MRYITALTMHNWGPFKGTHSLELDATVYAVVAEHETDPERSNWMGKTWFLSAMLFALTGQKPESCKVEDDWITHGEAEGWVEFEADDGTNVKRSRKRGHSTQLMVRLNEGKAQKQAVAQENLYDAMGLDGADLLATSFIQQKQIARLILADPSERTAIVNGWVDLEPLERAETWLREGLNKLLAEERKLAAESESADSLSEGAPDASDLHEAETDLAKLTSERDEMSNDVSALAQWKTHADHSEEFERIRTEGRELKATCDATETPDAKPLELARSKTIEAKATALDRQYQLRELVQDEWDGKCPLTCQDCPESTAVRAIGASMELELTEADVLVEEASGAEDDARIALNSATQQINTHERNKIRLVDLRKRAQRHLKSAQYIDEHGAPPDEKARDEELHALHREVDECSELVVKIRLQITRTDEESKAAERRAKRLSELQTKMRTHREAIAIVGRLGAQKEVAESALGQIRRGANDLLGQSGIDLTVDVSWAREGRGLATHCDACGAAHPKSQKVKTCAICGAERGPKLVEKLDIVPSDRSGAADDICGLAFQLAASSWLRTKRGASWSSTCIDEPFAALDAANSRALGVHLHAMIRGSYAFDQGFLVAHDPQAMESLPARIQITGGPNGASLEVV